MKNKLFSDFNPVLSKKWKQQIQFDLKGADYNDALIWESPEGIKTKPFYNSEEELNNFNYNTSASQFIILQNIFVYDVTKSNLRALETLNRGAESIRFTIENKDISIEDLMKNLPKENIEYYFNLTFLSVDYITNLNKYSENNNYQFNILIDPIGKLVLEGNWFLNLESDIENLNQINIFCCKSSIYQNAGANIVQQLAYILSHLNEYFNRVKTLKNPVVIEVSIGSNYFFEIAKLRALRILFSALAKEYNLPTECKIIATPTKRNKTLYDYNVNMLRTTTECMSAIIGGANAISNISYDSTYHKDNEFGDRISRNQLLVLKKESYFDVVNNPADGTYYIESLTDQLAEKSLILFKDIEANGGFLKQLYEGTIQRKINESAKKEQDLFDSGKEVLLGTNKYPNKNDNMKNDLELFPFVKTNPRKTLIIPIIEKRLAEKIEQDRLFQE